MREALDQAAEAGRRGEVPVGAVLVRLDQMNHGQTNHGQMLAHGANDIEAPQDPTGHADGN